MSGDLDKLKKCVLMLSSQHDGEVVSAARSITRVLGSAGLDWHWLASELNGVAGAPEPDKQSKKAGWTDVDAFEDHQAATDWLVANHRWRLRAKGLDFLDTMSCWRGELTEKQAVWLSDLCCRCGYRP